MYNDDPKNQQHLPTYLESLTRINVKDKDKQQMNARTMAVIQSEGVMFRLNQPATGRAKTATDRGTKDAHPVASRR
jgi:hypothetical protein